MVRGAMSWCARSVRIFSASSGLTVEGFHWRGDEEKIWKQLAPQSTARWTAVHVPPLVERWMPMRFSEGAMSSPWYRRIWLQPGGPVMRDCWRSPAFLFTDEAHHG